MMKQKWAVSLAIAAAVTVSMGFAAFAAEEKKALYTVTMGDSTADGMEIPNGEWKTDENGIRRFVTADGITISMVNEDNPDYEAIKLPRKVDEEGNQYIELEDGTRVYVSQSNAFQSI